MARPQPLAVGNSRPLPSEGPTRPHLPAPALPSGSLHRLRAVGPWSCRTGRCGRGGAENSGCRLSGGLGALHEPTPGFSWGRGAGSSLNLSSWRFHL